MMTLKVSALTDDRIVQILTPMLKDNESEISKDIMNIIENNKNFDEIIENKVDALDKKQNYVYEKDGEIYYGPVKPPEGTASTETLTGISQTVMVSNDTGDVIVINPDTNQCKGRFNQDVQCDFDYKLEYPTLSNSMANTKILDSTAVKFGDTVNNVDGVTITKSQNISLDSAENISVNGSSDIVIGNNCKDIEIVGAHDVIISDGVNNLHWLDVPIDGDYQEIQISYPKENDVIVNGKPIAPIYQIYQVDDAIYAGVLKFSKLSTADNLTTYTFKIGTIVR